jgi:thioredoxin 1
MKFLFAAPIAAIVMMAPAFAQQGAMQPYSKAAFDRAIAAGQPVVVHVHADWCPTCRRQQPVLNSFMRENGSKVQAFTVNFDSDKAFNQANRVTTQSTIIIFKGGKEVARAAGTTDEAAIRTLVGQAL